MRCWPCGSLLLVLYIRNGQELAATNRSMALPWCTATASDTMDTNIADSASVRSSQWRPVRCALCGVSCSGVMAIGKAYATSGGAPRTPERTRTALTHRLAQCYATLTRRGERNG